MKIANTKRIREKIMMIQQSRQLLNTINAVVSTQIANSIIEPEALKILQEQAKNIKHDSISVERLTLLLYIDAMTDMLLPGYNNEVKDFYMRSIRDETIIYDVNEIKNNPYIKNISFSNQQFGDYELCNQSFAPYELSFYDAPNHIDKVHIDIPRIGCFAEKFKYPSIRQISQDSTWMSVTPNEIVTMQNAINNATGKVLTLGCGMGYFAYMASLKSDVESITIIELEQDVIDLFEKYILPQFENKDKITIIKSDAIEYMKNVSDNDYDYCFADIWIGIADIEPYFAIKEVCRHLKKTKIEYWIEESFAAILSSCIWGEILKAFSKSNNLDIPKPEFELPDRELRKKSYIHRLMKNIEISKPEDIDYYLFPKNIIKLINKTKICF